MSNNTENRLMGAEIEYLASSEDKSFDYINEYYSGMREVNSILLPGSNILESLKVLKDIMLSMSKKIKHPLATRGWSNSYGFAYNGVHLHLSGDISREILEANVFKLINKHGMSPRTVTSWHILRRPTNYGFKNKRKHRPVYKTPRGTVEIRILDIEYFLDDAIIEDLAIAIEGAYDGKIIDGDDTWVRKLYNISLDDYKECCKFLDTNMSSNWAKLSEGKYLNKIGNYEFDFTSLPDWGRDREEEERIRRQEREEVMVAIEAIEERRARRTTDSSDSTFTTSFSSRFLDDN